jgi:hypothetical protein
MKYKSYGKSGQKAEAPQGSVTVSTAADSLGALS